MKCVGPIWRDGSTGRRAEQSTSSPTFSADGSRTGARITNMCYDGCEMDGIAMDVGDAVKLDLSGLGKVEAEIRWVIGDKGRARFVDR